MTAPTALKVVPERQVVPLLDYSTKTWGSVCIVGDGAEWSDLPPGYFIPGERANGSCWIKAG